MFNVLTLSACQFNYIFRYIGALLCLGQEWLRCTGDKNLEQTVNKLF